MDPSDAGRTLDSPMATGTWQLEPCSYGEVVRLAQALELDEVTASVLVRRGLRGRGRRAQLPRRRAAGPRPVRARRHDARRSRSIPAAVDAGARICVHGDYDADGICATALAVLLLRELGADVAWHLPSRFEEGYGLNARDARRGSPTRAFDLVLTVDCGITAVAEVELRGLARPRRSSSPTTTGPAETFPACPVVAPLKGDYPFAGLCGTGGRLEARRGAARAGAPVPRAPPRRRRARDRRRRRPARRREPRARAARACVASRRRRSPGCGR